MKTASVIARYLAGVIFLVFGLNGFLNFIPLPPPGGIAGQFMGALYASHYLWVIFAFQVIAGVLLLVNRYVPLAVAVLAPVIVNILVFHALMAPAGLPLAILVTLLWAVIFIDVRPAFSRCSSRACSLRPSEARVELEKVDGVLDLVGGDTQKRSFPILKEGGLLVSATQPVSQEEAATHRVSGVMMRLTPSGEVLGRIGRLLEEGTIRPDLATLYALQDVAQAWKDIARNLPGVHGMSPSGPGAGTRKSHGKIVLRVA